MKSPLERHERNSNSGVASAASYPRWRMAVVEPRPGLSDKVGFVLRMMLVFRMVEDTLVVRMLACVWRDGRVG